MSNSTERWTEYTIGMCFFFLRFFARFKVVGINGLAWDDFFFLIAMILWTVDAATVQIITDYGSFVGLNEQSAAALTDAEAARLEVGSKALFVAWISYVTLIWSLKASLLFFYSRLTLGLWQQKFVKVMGIICFVAYMAVILTLFGHCTPIQKNWQIKPYAGDKCTVMVANFYSVAVLNVLTDAGILAIPLPIIWKVKIPLGRKLIIGLLLSSGIFVITAALLRCVLSLADLSHVSKSTIWGIRETFVSVIAISAPAIRPLFNKERWIGSSNDQGASTGKFIKFGKQRSVSEITPSGKSVPRDGDQNHDLEAGRSWQVAEGADSDMELKHMSGNGSEEQIVCKNENNLPLEINVATVYTLVDDEKAGGPKAAMAGSDRDGSATVGEAYTTPFGSVLESRSGRWGLSGGENITKVTVGDKTKAKPKVSKASRMLGMGS